MLDLLDDRDDFLASLPGLFGGSAGGARGGGREFSSAVLPDFEDCLAPPPLLADDRVRDAAAAAGLESVATRTSKASLLWALNLGM